ncbi:MAG: SDR family oxidoreductase [Deltaproteobacteria bacterium]|nr:SDR family oxidoreductase [Deltaproteobacteria bacterium]
MRGLKGKVAIVTGGSSGIGRATAVAFGREGTKVVILSNQPKEGEETAAEIEAAGGEARFINADVSRSADVRSAIDKTVEIFGKLDIAFNNAGINGELAVIDEYSEEGWDTIIDINLKGVWLSMKYEIPHMLKTGGGVIINTASIGGVVGLPLNIAGYIASKHGVLGLTKVAALEYATKGIRVNAICPGAIRTPLNQDLPDEIVAPILSRHPIGRIGRPDEVSELVLMLCSDAASFVTGASIMIDGGYTAQ